MSTQPTDWLAQAGYGVFVHYLNGIQNNSDHVASLGRQTSWDECVSEFDTERFAATMSEAGAGYVIFTVMQISANLIAPNATFDRISGHKPGEACAQRDLIADLYSSLSARGIKLMLYYTGDGPRGEEQSAKAFGWGEPIGDEFVQRWADVAAEYGQRYGDKVAGYWVDGCYTWIGYNDDKLAILAKGLKAGFPGRIIAFNPGVDPAVRAYSQHEDFTCGEQNTFLDMPVQRLIDGKRWHLLSFLGSAWGAPGVRYSKRDLSDYIYDVNQRGGVVSVDVMLYRDGTLDRSQLEVLKAVRAELRTGRPKPPVPPGNLAYRKPARLLSLDGSHDLVVNSGIHFAKRGVDGRLDTIALGAEEWPWTYQVDLIDTIDVRRIKVTFGGGYATEFEIVLSADGQQWQTVLHKTDHDGAPVDLTIGPVKARYVRVRGLKPDGPDQQGSQMAIGELEVYG